MFGKKKTREAGITLIANNCELSGDVRFSDHLLVNGTIKGNIYAKEDAKAMVTISEKGRVEGDIVAPNVVVNGKVDGDIHCDKHIELASKAEVKGNVFYNLIEMVMGSRVDGNLVHFKDGDDKDRSEKNTQAAKNAPAKAPAAMTSPKQAAGSVSAVQVQVPASQ